MKRTDKVDPRGSKPPTSVIVTAIADETDQDPVDMTPPLGNVIDVEALDRILRNPNLEAITFEYDDRSIELHNDGRVDVKTSESTY